MFTLIVVVTAASVLWKIVDYYMFAPWTRDGHVRADVDQVAPDVSGIVTEVRIVDNQRVKRGDVLFVIDQARYALALRNAQAAAQQRNATLDQARREDARNRALGDLVAREVVEETHSRVETAAAALEDAEVAIDTARLNLQRTVIVSPVDGFLNDRAPRVGEFVSAGRAVLSVVDLHSFRVDGYFEETKLRGINIGQSVDIKVMGEPKILRGHVQSIVAAIEDRDRQQSASLLPNVNPAFSWVRLAQRVPVRVALDEFPDDIRMIAGRTATVSLRKVGTSTRQRAASDSAVASASVTSDKRDTSTASAVFLGAALSNAMKPASGVLQ